MTSQEKYKLLKKLTKKELSEISKNNNIPGYSSKKQEALAQHLADNLNLNNEEIEKLVNAYWEDKLISKIKDAEDYILRKGVEIKAYEKNLIKAKAGKYKVTIYNLGEKNFKYNCTGGCNDFKYQVKKGKYPFCKHYPAVIAELIYTGKLNPNEKNPNHISGTPLEALNDIIQMRRKEEGIITPKGRNIDNILQNLKGDLIEISKQNNKLSRAKYHETPEKVFKNLVNEAFKLLDYETIPQRREQGWDLLMLELTPLNLT